MSRIVGIAATILIVVGIGAGILWLTESNGGPSVAFADVVQPFLNARTATFTVRMKVRDLPDQEIEMMFMEPGRMRGTMKEGLTVIFDSQQGKSVSLDPKTKTALVLEMQNMGKDHDLQSEEMLFFNTREYIRKALESEDKTVKYLGKGTIDGRNALGYHISEHLVEITLWADAATQLPIQIETSITLGEDKLMTYIMDHFAFNVELDEALFSVEIPKGYTRENLKIDASKPSEKDIVEMFRVWTEATDGKFPSALNMAAMKEFSEATVNKDIQKYEDDMEEMTREMKKVEELVTLLNERHSKMTAEQRETWDEELEKKLAEIEKASKEKPPQLAEKPPIYEPVIDIQTTTSDSMTVTRGLIFVNTLPASSNWHYAGKGVKLGDANTAIFWYNPKGSEAYKVIYGDLSIKEVLPQDLPK